MIIGNGVSLELEDFEEGLMTTTNVTDNLKQAVRSFERQHIEKVLDKAGGDKKLCAELLGISRSALFDKLFALQVGKPSGLGRPRKA